MPRKSKLPENPSEDDILFALLSGKVTQAIDPNSVFYTGIKGGMYVFTLGGKMIPEKVMRELKSEAKVMQKLDLTKIIIETLENAAKLKMFEQMQSIEDSHYGKTMLYNTSVIEKVIANLANAPVGEKPPLTK